MKGWPQGKAGKTERSPYTPVRRLNETERLVSYLDGNPNHLRLVVLFRRS